MKIDKDKVPDVSIIDYGINNLKSISKAFEKIGKTYRIIDKPEDVLSAKCLILPGIGAFGDGMNGLRQRGLIKPIKQEIKEGTPLLCICLGMQMLFTESEEFGLHDGLDFVSGRVVPLKQPNEVNIERYKVPHMGWNELNKPKSSNNESKWENTLLENIEEKSDVYFVHSFYPVVDNPKELIATAEYGNQEFCAVVKKDNVTGTQFHPEKSGKAGLNMLKTFCKLNKI
jgi:glutamine amidotransferase